MKIERKDSTRELKRRTVAFKATDVKDSGEFEGYASVFGNVDSYGDVVAAGAFKDSIATLKTGGDPLPILWQHRSSEPIGGSDFLEEDDHGLKTRGFLLIDEIPQAKSAHTLMKRRIVKGLSIGYYTRDSSYDEKTGVRTLKALDLVEYSVVTFPANELATVDSVKARSDLFRGGALPSLKDFEAFLREAGASKTVAVAIAGKGLRAMLLRSESGGDPGEVLSLLSNFNLSKE